MWQQAKKHWGIMAISVLCVGLAIPVFWTARERAKVGTIGEVLQRASATKDGKYRDHSLKAQQEANESVETNCEKINEGDAVDAGGDAIDAGAETANETDAVDFSGDAVDEGNEELEDLKAAIRRAAGGGLPEDEEKPVKTMPNVVSIDEPAEWWLTGQDNSQEMSLIEKKQREQLEREFDELSAKIMLGLDKDRDNKISVEEIRRMLAPNSSTEDADQVLEDAHHVVNIFDMDGDGSLSLVEVQEFLADSDLDLFKEELSLIQKSNSTYVYDAYDALKEVQELQTMSCKNYCALCGSGDTIFFGRAKNYWKMAAVTLAIAITAATMGVGAAFMAGGAGAVGGAGAIIATMPAGTGWLASTAVIGASAGAVAATNYKGKAKKTGYRKSVSTGFFCERLAVKQFSKVLVQDGGGGAEDSERQFMDYKSTYDLLKPWPPEKSKFKEGKTPIRDNITDERPGGGSYIYVQSDVQRYKEGCELLYAKGRLRAWKTVSMKGYCEHPSTQAVYQCASLQNLCGDAGVVALFKNSQLTEKKCKQYGDYARKGFSRDPTGTDPAKEHANVIQWVKQQWLQGKGELPGGNPDGAGSLQCINPTGILKAFPHPDEAHSQQNPLNEEVLRLERQVASANQAVDAQRTAQKAKTQSTVKERVAAINAQNEAAEEDSSLIDVDPTAGTRTSDEVKEVPDSVMDATVGALTSDEQGNFIVEHEKAHAAGSPGIEDEGISHGHRRRASPDSLMGHDEGDDKQIRSASDEDIRNEPEEVN